MSESFEFSRPLKRLCGLNYLVLLAAASGFVLFPSLAGLAGFGRHAGGPLALLFAAHVPVLAAASMSTHFKGRPGEAASFLVGAVIVCVLCIGGIDAGLIWQAVASLDFSQWPMVGLFLPLGTLGWVLVALGQRPAKRDGLTSLASDDTRPDGTRESRAERVLKSLRRLFVLAVGSLLLTVQVCVLAPAAFSFYLILKLVLIDDRSISPREMAGLLDRLGGTLIENYANLIPHALGVVLAYLALMAVLLAAILLPLNWLMNKLQKADGRNGLPVETDVLDSAVAIYRDWLENRPKRALGSVVLGLGMVTSFTTIPIAFLALAQTIRWSVGQWVGRGTESLHFESAGMAGLLTAGLIGIFIALLLAIAGGQVMPVFRPAWLDASRTRLYRSPELTLWEIRSALISAATRGWYDVQAAFDPDQFHRRWCMRGVNLARDMTLWSVLPIALLSAADGLAFRSWETDQVRWSSYFSTETQVADYADALAVEMRCRVREGKNGLVPDLGLTLVFPADRRVAMGGRIGPGQLDVLEQIDRAARDGGAQIVPDTGGDPAACRAFLRGRWGDAGARIGAILAPVTS